VKADSSI